MGKLIDKEYIMAKALREKLLKKSLGIEFPAASPVRHDLPRKEPLLSYYSNRGYCWFRIKGYGLLIKDAKKLRLLFSEQSGLKGINIGRFHFHVLKPFGI